MKLKLKEDEDEVEVDERKNVAALTLCTSSYPKAATPERHMSAVTCSDRQDGVFAGFDLFVFGREEGERCGLSAGRRWKVTSDLPC